jgi:hypothetical protein
MRAYKVLGLVALLMVTACHTGSGPGDSEDTHTGDSSEPDEVGTVDISYTFMGTPVECFVNDYDGEDLTKIGATNSPFEVPVGSYEFRLGDKTDGLSDDGLPIHNLDNGYRVIAPGFDAEITVDHTSDSPYAQSKSGNAYVDGEWTCTRQEDGWSLTGIVTYTDGHTIHNMPGIGDLDVSDNNVAFTDPDGEFTSEGSLVEATSLRVNVDRTSNGEGVDMTFVCEPED